MHNNIQQQQQQQKQRCMVILVWFVTFGVMLWGGCCGSPTSTRSPRTGVVVEAFTSHSARFASPMLMNRRTSVATTTKASSSGQTMTRSNTHHHWFKNKNTEIRSSKNDPNDATTTPIARRRIMLSKGLATAFLVFSIIISAEGGLLKAPQPALAFTASEEKMLNAKFTETNNKFTETNNKIDAASNKYEEKFNTIFWVPLSAIVINAYTVMATGEKTERNVEQKNQRFKEELKVEVTTLAFVPVLAFVFGIILLDFYRN